MIFVGEILVGRRCEFWLRFVNLVFDDFVVGRRGGIFGWCNRINDIG